MQETRLLWHNQGRLVTFALPVKPRTLAIPRPIWRTRCKTNPSICKALAILDRTHFW